MTTIEIPYKPRAHQLKVHQLTWDNRYGVAVCHRRFGKSVLAVNELVRRALSTDRDDFRGNYIGPTYTQTKAIVWDYLKQFAEPVPGVRFNESELRVDFPNGSRIRLFGGDKPDALRGLYHDCVFFDEFDDTKPNLWTQVVYPATVDRHGSACFIGTYLLTNGPLGQQYDHALVQDDWFAVTHRASDTDVVSKDELRVARFNMSEEEYEREFECNRTSSVKGAYYAKQMLHAEKDKRITRVPYDAALSVVTGWDIGFDMTAVWFCQPSGRELRFIDYFEVVNEDIIAPAKNVLARKDEHDWRYSMHYFPHDMEARDFTGGGDSRLQAAVKLGLRPAKAVPRRMAQKLMETHEGINAVRRVFPRMVFDADKCKVGLDRLRSYRPRTDAQGRTLPQPEHDESSHGATALEQVVRGIASRPAARVTYRQPDVGWVS